LKVHPKQTDNELTAVRKKVHSHESLTSGRKLPEYVFARAENF